MTTETKLQTCPDCGDELLPNGACEHCAFDEKHEQTLDALLNVVYGIESAEKARRS